MSGSIRLRATPNGNDKYLTLKLEQDFDFIEILSLKLSQEKAYENFCSDYGAIVGRIVINNGFGIPNAKVSVFIPISEEDKNNPFIKGLYPYEKVTDVNEKGIRYNLLCQESDSKDDCYTPVGTLPPKREILDNPEVSEIYKKYYKFTTITNYAGDFMIFGVPLGQQTVHVDVDISNIGIASQRPYDLISQGVSSKLFKSPTKFKASNNLGTLPQIKTTDASVDVRPFWGDPDNCVIGINRLDINLNYNITPSAIFMGSIFGDSRKNSINKRCRPRKRLGAMCEQITREGTIETLRKTIDNEIERFDIEGGRLIDENGVWAYQIPMNLDYVITDEYGNLIPSESTDRGIPTRARLRFRISMDEGGGIGRLRTRGKYIVPHNPSQINEIDFSFDQSTPDNENTFRDFYWNKIYSVKNYIARTEKNQIAIQKPFKLKTYTGIKDVDGCVGDKNPMPYNKTFVKGNVLFAIICFMYSLIAGIACAFNGFLCIFYGIKILGIRPFGWTKIFMFKLKCPNENKDKFRVCCGPSIEEYLDCVKAVLADELNLFQFDFYNDWVNGTLYYYLLKYKKRRKGKREKFCEYRCNDFEGGTGSNSCKESLLRDTTYGTRTTTRIMPFINGLLVKYEDQLYYPPILLNGTNKKMFPTDIVNLGAVFDCDWQGFPKIINYLTDSSYKLPPVQAESSAEDNDGGNDPSLVPGMFDSYIVQNGQSVDGLFFEIRCIEGVNYDSIGARNIKRICELNVDIPEYTATYGIPGVPQITINEIYDTTDPLDVQYSINRYVRDSFFLLNTNGSGISALPSIPNPTTSFDETDYITFTKQRNFDSKNSFYMYFGIVPGKTAIEKVKSNYFTECIREINNEYVIATLVQNLSIVGANDGTVTITFVGGAGPFTYTINGVDISYSYGPRTVASTDTVISLAPGTYEIIAVDTLGTIVVKNFTVEQPKPLSCSFNVLETTTSQFNADGTFIIANISGGRFPYTVEFFNANGGLLQTFTNPAIGTEIPNIGVGWYTFVVTDGLNNTCTKRVEMTGPLPVGIINLELINACDNCGGNFTFDVSGGTSPYSATVVTSAGAVVNTQNEFIYTNLCVGTYTINVVDSGIVPLTTSLTVQITSGLYGRATQYEFEGIFGQTVVISFYIDGGVPPYDVSMTPGNPDVQFFGCTGTRCYYKTFGLDSDDDIYAITSDENGCQKYVFLY